jgi:hypothetical protein
MDKERLLWIIRGIDFEKLNDWEERFLEACEKRMEIKGDLTDPMEEIVERLYKEKRI